MLNHRWPSAGANHCGLRQLGFRLRLVGVTLALLVTAACGGSGGSSTQTPPVLTSVTLAPASPSVNVGSTKQFTATAAYSDGSSKDVTASAAWSSSDATIASVESTGQASPGLATGVKAGSATITASYGGANGSTTLTVDVTRVVTSITVSPTAATVKVGSTLQFNATATYNDGSTGPVTGSAAWSSSDTAFASILTTGQSNPGLATGVAPGSTTITASYSGVSGSTTLSVVSVPVVTSMTLSPTSASLNVGSTLQFSATAGYSDGSMKIVTTSAAWSSSDSTVASIQTTGQSSPGLATGLKAGSTTITALYSGVNGSTTLTVTSPVVTSITLAPIGPSINQGGTQQFSATAGYSDGSMKVVTNSAAWSSSDSTIASIQTTEQASPGLATGVKAGGVTITASYGGVKGSTSLTVAPVVTSITLSPTNPSINVGSTQQFTATAGYSDGSMKIVTNSASWSSSDSSIASINSTGLAQGVAAGNGVNITATYAGVSGVTTLNVTSSSGNLSSFFIGQIDPSIAPSATLQLFSYAEYTDGTQQWVTSTTHWTSSKTSVATIEDQGGAAPGLVTATTTPGTTTITATFGGLTQTTTVTVAANAVPFNLMDMTSSQNYLGYAGGLYENNSDTPPAQHDAAGKTAAAAVKPLNQSGNSSAAGAIVFLGIGMSNAKEEFSAFQATATSTSSVNHATLAMEDGSSGAATACYWTVATGSTLSSCPNAMGVLLDNQYDRVRDTVLATATTAPSAPKGCGGPPNPTPCLTEKQVQVLWIKNANPRPGIPSGVPSERTLCDTSDSGCVNDMGTEAINYESQLGQIIRAAKSRYPNLQQVFVSSRIYAGYATDGLNPEPYAYEYGFSAKWLIEAQVLQIRNGTVDPVAGDLDYTDGAAAWTAWGAYIWADGPIKRSDGLEWLSTDFQSDGTHPNGTGTTKVVGVLMNFYTTSPYTIPWFLAP